MLYHHRTIKPYRMRSYIVWAPFTFVIIESVLNPKQNNRLLFVEEIYNWYSLCTHIGMLACLFAFFQATPIWWLIWWLVKCRYPEKVIFLCIRLEIWSASRWEFLYFFWILEDSTVCLALCNMHRVYPLTIIRKRTKDLSIVDANCIAWTLCSFIKNRIRKKLWMD